MLAAARARDTILVIVSMDLIWWVAESKETLEVYTHDLPLLNTVRSRAAYVLILPLSFGIKIAIFNMLFRVTVTVIQMDPDLGALVRFLVPNLQHGHVSLFPPEKCIYMEMHLVRTVHISS